MVLPDGFMLVLEPFAEPAVLPVELPLPLMVLPLDPVVPPPTLPPLIPAAPPADPPAEPPPAPPPACAFAKVLESTKAEARAIVLSFMLIFSWVEVTINRGSILCSSLWRLIRGSRAASHLQRLRSARENPIKQQLAQHFIVFCRTAGRPGPIVPDIFDHVISGCLIPKVPVGCWQEVALSVPSRGHLARGPYMRACR